MIRNFLINILFSIPVWLIELVYKFNKDVKIELQNFAKTQFKNGFDYMISGHYHLGEIYNLDQGKLAVLGDWFHRPSYAKYDGKDLSLLQWEENV